jgi:hypothetical protein
MFVKIFDATLMDQPNKRFKGSVAEMTRPNRAAEQRVRDLKKLKEKKGRKRSKPVKDAVYHNWMTPTVWPQIEAAAKHPSVGSKMSTSAMVKVLKRQNATLFEGISRGTIDGWIDRSDPGHPKWKDAVLERAERGNFQGHPNGGRRGILVSLFCRLSSFSQLISLKSRYPDVADLLVHRIKGLRESGAPVTLVTVRALFVATILDQAPEIFNIRCQKDGSYFKASDSFLRRWLRETLVWSTRRPTNAAQKLPDNWEDLCEKSFLRIAYAVKEHDIPAGLIVNADQTQVVYALGTGLTWAEKGAKQVSAVGLEEKRAFKTMIALSVNGTYLATQLIYQGSTAHSRPDSHVRGYHQLADIGCKLVSLCTDTYWSNFGTRRSLSPISSSHILRGLKPAFAYLQARKPCTNWMSGWAIIRRSFVIGLQPPIHGSFSISFLAEPQANGKPLTLGSIGCSNIQLMLPKRRKCRWPISSSTVNWDRSRMKAWDGFGTLGRISMI